MKIEFDNLNSKLYSELEGGQIFSDLAPYETRDSYNIYLKVDSENYAIRLIDGVQEEFPDWAEVYPLNATLVIK
jgi:hypothetical protein